MGGLERFAPLLRRKPVLVRVLGGLVFVLVLLLAARDLQAAGRSVLAWGDRGKDVAGVQAVLRQRGFYEGPVDGFYNRATVHAVAEFQRRHNLPVRGVVRAGTYKLLLSFSSKNIVDPTAENIYLLASIIESEAAGEPYVGKLAVGAVILNRVASPMFPDTLAGVIFQPGAFESVRNGQFGRPASAQSRRAAREALAGKDPTGGALYFWNPSKPVNAWVWQRRQVTRIGRHVFAR